MFWLWGRDAPTMEGSGGGRVVEGELDFAGVGQDVLGSVEGIVGGADAKEEVRITFNSSQ